MLPEDRAAALHIGMTGPRADHIKPVLQHVVARDRHFRPQTVARWSDDHLVNAASGLRSVHLGKSDLQSMISSLHLAKRRTLLSAFLSAAGIPHDDGVFVETPQNDCELDPDLLLAAATRVSVDFPEAEVLTYLLALRVMWPVAFRPLDVWLQQYAPAQSPVALHAPRASDAGSDVQEAAQYVDVRTFTSLDRRIILTIVDSVAGIEGAASEDEIDDLLLELQELNGRRHRTFFHAGFRDSLFERAPTDHLAAENDGRRRWYWAGYLIGLTRREEWSEIARLFDTAPTVKTLGSVGDGASDAAATFVFSALVRQQRYGEATTFAQRDAVAASRNLQIALLDTGTQLVRHQRAFEARPILDTLFSVLSGYDDPSPDIDARRIETQRRLALCFRQLGETDQAEQLLKPLTTHDNPEIRGTSLSDLGLLKTHYRRLGELSLPTDKRDAQQLRDRIECGVAEFEQAISLPLFQAPHAHFALGVRAFIADDYVAARDHFEYALSWFSGRPAVYQIDGTLELTRLYLGLAIVLSLDTTSALERACDLIRTGLDGGAQLVPWLVRSTIEALGVARGDLVNTTATLILDKCGGGVLDELTASGEGENIQAVRTALTQRALDISRQPASRAADAYQVLPWLIHHGENESAAQVLELIEEFAHRGILQQEFKELLSDPSRVSPAWEDDRVLGARIRLLEAAGDFETATGELEAYCYQVLASNDSHAIDLADVALGEVESYGPAGREVAERLRDIIDARIARVAPELDTNVAGIGASYPIHILVVGGSEQQHRMEDDVRAQVAERFPGVSLDFLQTGWSGNWSGYVSEFERRVAWADGVVFLSLMRTMFGRSVRAKCGVPWRGCSGRGQGVIVNTIARLLPDARGHLARQHQEHTLQSSSNS